MTQMPLLSARGLGVTYEARSFLRKTRFNAIRNIDFDIAPGEALGLVGESGSGKTTLGRAILGLAPITAGELTFDGRPINNLTPEERRGLSSDIQVIFQDPYSSLNPRMKIREILSEPMRVHNIISDSAARDKRVLELLNVVGLSARFADRYPHEMSGGQRQRVAMGRALLLQRRFADLLSDLPLEGTAPPLDFEILLLRAEAQLGLGQVEEARAALDRAAQAHSEDPRVHLGRARLAFAAGDFAAAQAEAEGAVARQPGLVEALLLLGEARRLKGDPEAALAPFQEVLGGANRRPGITVRARLGLAAALLALGRDAEAESEVAAVRKVAPDLPLAAYLQVVIQVRRQDFGEARRTLDAAAPALGEFPPAQFLFGLVAFAEGELETARSWLTRHLSAQADNLPARKLLAATLLQLNAPKDALRELEPARSAAPDDPQVLMLLGNAYLRTGQAREASALLQRAAELAPQDPRVLSQLAVSHLATGKRDEALTALNATLDLGADASMIGYALAFAQLRAGAFEEALKIAQDLRQRFPQSVIAANLEGAAQAALGRMEEAQAAFEAVLDIDPQFHEARFNLAALKARAGDFAAAEAEYQTVLTAEESNAEAMLGLAALANRGGDAAGAEAWLRKAVKADPDAVKPSLALADYHATQADLAAAEDVIESLAARHPRNPQVLQALGRVQMQSGKPAAAVRTFQRLVEASGRSAAARLLLAEAQLGAGDLAAAQRTYEVLKGSAGDNPVVWNNLAWLYQQADDSRAVAHGERALALAPGQPAIMDTLGWILLEEGQLDRAADLLGQAHEAAPGAGEIAYHYAVALHKKGDDAAARALLTSLLDSGEPFSSQADAQALLEQLGS